MNIQKNIAATLKAAMAERDLNIVGFAEEIGIARTSLQGYLKEESNPRADTIELLSEKLHIPPAVLISGPDACLSGPEPLYEGELHPALDPLMQQCRGMMIELRRLSAALMERELLEGDERYEPDYARKEAIDGDN